MQLDNLYHNYLNTVFSDEEVVNKMKSSVLSSPLLIDMNVKKGMIADKKFKLLLVGQQTKGWVSKIKNSDLDIDQLDFKDYINGLKEKYYNFNFGNRLDGKTYRGYFWQFQQNILKKLNQNLSDNFGLLWTNIIRFDEKGGKIKDKRLLEKIGYNNNEILLNEISILKPDVVIFTTGYTYDNLLKMTFSEIEFKPSSNDKLNKNKLSILESNLLPKLSFRTYHPRPLYINKYLKGSRNQIIDTIVDIIKKELN